MLCDGVYMYTCRVDSESSRLDTAKVIAVPNYILTGLVRVFFTMYMQTLALSVKTYHEGMWSNKIVVVDGCNQTNCARTTINTEESHAISGCDTVCYSAIWWCICISTC